MSNINPMYREFCERPMIGGFPEDSFPVIDLNKIKDKDTARLVQHSLTLDASVEGFKGFVKGLVTLGGSIALVGVAAQTASVAAVAIALGLVYLIGKRALNSVAFHQMKASHLDNQARNVRNKIFYTQVKSAAWEFAKIVGVVTLITLPAYAYEIGRNKTALIEQACTFAQNKLQEVCVK